MTKWLTYLGILMILIVLTILTISASKAGFLIVEECGYAYRPCSIEEKYSLLFHGNAEPIKPFPVTRETLPEDLQWRNGAEQEPFADPRARKGGILNQFITTFPQTLRQRGLNANTSFRSYLDLNDMTLLDIHPVTEGFFPSLALEWAIGPDRQTVYYRLDPEARWSDGVPVTADDYIFMLKLYRAPGIADPWTNTYMIEQVDDILKFDDYTIAVRLPRRTPNIVYSTLMSPEPYHFYGNLIPKEHTFRGKTAYYRFKNRHRPIPEQLTYYEIQDNLDALESFVVSMAGRMDIPPSANQRTVSREPADQNHLLSRVIDARAEAARLSDSMSGASEIETIRKLSGLMDDLAQFKGQLARMEPPPEQARTPYTLTVDDVSAGWNKTFNWRAKPNTGPYQIEKFMQGKWIRFKRNPDWWAEHHRFYSYRYNPAYMHIRLISNTEIAFEYFKQGELDTFGLTLAEYWYKKAADTPQYRKGYIQKYWFWNDIPRPSRLISMNLENEILKDRNVRLGIAHALNIQKVIDLAMLGDARQADTITTGYRGYTHPDIKAREYDVGKAIGYLEKAGWSEMGPDGIRVRNGRRLSVKLLYFSPLEKEFIMILKEEAAKAGIEFKPDTYDANTVFKFVQDKKHEMVWHGWNAWSNLRGPTYYGQYHSSNAGVPNNNNFCNYADAQVDRLLDTYRNSNDDNERKKLAHRIQAQIHDAACAIPTFYIPFNRMAAWRWLRIPDCAELPTSETLMDYGLYWIDEEMKKETLHAMKTGTTYPVTLRVFDRYKPESGE